MSDSTDRNTRRHRVVYVTEDEAKVLNGGKGSGSVLSFGLARAERCCGHLELFHRRGIMCTYCVICGHIEDDKPREFATAKPERKPWWRWW